MASLHGACEGCGATGCEAGVRWRNGRTLCDACDCDAPPAPVPGGGRSIEEGRACGGADCPGWSTFDVSGTVETQRCDACDRFEDDGAAIADVRGVLRALFGGRGVDPEEAVRVLVNVLTEHIQADDEDPEAAATPELLRDCLEGLAADLAALAYNRGEDCSELSQAGPPCGHSVCSQNYIDTGERRCVRGEHDG